MHTVDQPSFKTGDAASQFSAVEALFVKVAKRLPGRRHQCRMSFNEQCLVQSIGFFASWDLGDRRSPLREGC